MLKLTKNGTPIGYFADYHDLYQYLTDWKNRKPLENPLKLQQGFLSSLAIEGILNATGIDYEVPTYQTLPHQEGRSTNDQGEGDGREPLPMPIDLETAADVLEHPKLWCLAYCRVYGLTVTETHGKGTKPETFVEDKTTVLSMDAVNEPGPKDQGGVL